MGQLNSLNDGVTCRVNGQVTVNDAPTNSRLYRFCEKQIDQWVRKLGAKEIDAEFKVEFTDETEGIHGARQISCVAEVTIAGTHWKGCDLAADSQQAFMHALKHMHLH